MRTKKVTLTICACLCRADAIEELSAQLETIEVQHKTSMEKHIKELHDNLAKIRFPANIDAYTPAKEEASQLNLCVLRNRMQRIQLLQQLHRSEAQVRQQYSTVWRQKLQLGNKQKYRSYIGKDKAGSETYRQRHI